MSAINSIFEGLFGYEKLMQIFGFTLFVFVLPATTHVALANAYLKFGVPGNAKAKLDQMRKLNLRVRFGHALQRVATGTLRGRHELADSNGVMTMDVLHKGDQGTQVRQLQQLLAQRGYAADINGTFDPQTWQALRAFQTQNLDQHGQPLVVDGVAGPLTWWSLQKPKPYIKTPSGVDSAMLLAIGGRAALAAAIGELKANAREIGGDNCGPFVRKCLAPAGLGEGQSWCALIVSWCFLQGVGRDKSAMPFPYIASARSLLAEFKQQGWSSTPGRGYVPVPGDVVVWWRVSLAGWLGHTDPAHSVQNGMAYTIEGNRSPSEQGFSHVPNRMDKLLGIGRVP